MTIAVIEPTPDLLRTIPAGEAVELPPAEGWMQWDLAERLRDGMAAIKAEAGEARATYAELMRIEAMLRRARRTPPPSGGRS